LSTYPENKREYGSLTNNTEKVDLESSTNNSETSKRILKSLYYRGLIDYNKMSETNFINILKSKSDSKIGEYANLLSSKQKKTDKRKHMVVYRQH
jgi:hypothetical protein